MNGNNFISAVEIDSAVFENNLSPVMVTSGAKTEVHEQMDLVQNVRHDDGTYWFILRDVTPDELLTAKLRADIDFIAMMTDVEL